MAHSGIEVIHFLTLRRKGVVKRSDIGVRRANIILQARAGQDGATHLCSKVLGVEVRQKLIHLGIGPKRIKIFLLIGRGIYMKRIYADVFGFSRGQREATAKMGNSFFIIVRIYLVIQT